MKLATFVRNDGAAAVGAVDTTRGAILDLAKAANRTEPAFQSMLALIEGGKDSLAKARDLAMTWPEQASQPLEGTKLLSPLPVPPSRVMNSPAFTVVPRTDRVPALASMRTSPAPATQGLPMPRATTAAWLVMPPVEVRMPSAACMP